MLAEIVKIRTSQHKLWPSIPNFRDRILFLNTKYYILFKFLYKVPSLPRSQTLVELYSWSANSLHHSITTAEPCNVVKFRAVHFPVLYWSVHYSILHHFTVQYWSVYQSTVQYYKCILHCILLHYTSLHCRLLQCTFVILNSTLIYTSVLDSEVMYTAVMKLAFM